MRLKKQWLSLLVGLVLGIAALTGCNPTGTGGPAAPATTTTTKPTDGTTPGSSSTTTQAAKPETCVVDGREVPAVGGCRGDASVPPIGGPQANSDSRTPPVSPLGATTPANWKEKILQSWCSLDAEPHPQGFWDGLQRTAGVTRQQVSDYCAIEKAQSVDLRVILVVGGNPISDAEARALVTRDGVPNAERLPVVRYASIVNTRGIVSGEMEEFLDGRSMVRVALVPPNLDPAGKVIGVDVTRGVFIDCRNAWRLPKTVYKPSEVCPPGTAMAGQPLPPGGPEGCNPPPSTAPPGTSPPGTSPPGTTPPDTSPPTTGRKGNVPATVAPPPVTARPPSAPKPTPSPTPAPTVRATPPPTQAPPATAPPGPPNTGLPPSR